LLIYTVRSRFETLQPSNQERFQVTLKLVVVNSWVMQIYGQRIPDSWTGRSQGTWTKRAATNTQCSQLTVADRKTTAYHVIQQYLPKFSIFQLNLVNLYPASHKSFSQRLLLMFACLNVYVNYAVVTTTIRRPFDGRSTKVIKVIMS